MENLVWGARDSQGKVTSMKLHLGDPEGEVIATFVYDTSASPDVQFATLEGDSPEKIDLVFNGKGGAKADRPNGASFSAHPNKQRFSRSDEIILDLGQRSLRMVNEAKSDWVIEDQDGTKLGQFSGANHGVRHVAENAHGGADAEQMSRVVQRSEHDALFDAFNHFIVDQARFFEAFATMYHAVADCADAFVELACFEFGHQGFHGAGVVWLLSQAHGVFFAVYFEDDTCIGQIKFFSQAAQQNVTVGAV